MILRRVIAHFRRQEWTAIFLDFVIVVIGVFVGLQAQEWSKNFSDRQREAQIMARDLPSAPGLNPPRPIPVRAPGRLYVLSAVSPRGRRRPVPA